MKASKTNDEVLANTPLHDLTLDQAVDYLEENPRHALVIVGSAGEVYVLRGAGDDLCNFYYGYYPAEDPNDANGGDLTAREAVNASLVLANQ